MKTNSSLNEIDKEKFEKKRKAYNTRLKLINHFIQTKSNPHWMIIYNLPVLPPNLRPVVKLQDKTLITTDLNFLYAKIININNKINKLRKMLVPEPFLFNEKYTLQENVHKLIKNEKSTNITAKTKNMRIQKQ